MIATSFSRPRPTMSRVSFFIYFTTSHSAALKKMQMNILSFTPTVTDGCGWTPSRCFGSGTIRKLRRGRPGFRTKVSSCSSRSTIPFRHANACDCGYHLIPLPSWQLPERRSSKEHHTDCPEKTSARCTSACLRSEELCDASMFSKGGQHAA